MGFKIFSVIALMLFTRTALSLSRNGNQTAERNLDPFAKSMGRTVNKLRPNITFLHKNILYLIILWLKYDFVFFTIQMLEDGMLRAAAPECRYGPGWIYWNGHCYQYTSYHEDFLKAEEICNEQGAYLADIITAQEGAWIKSVLLLINPKGIYNSCSSMCRDVKIVSNRF